MSFSILKFLSTRDVLCAYRVPGSFGPGSFFGPGPVNLYLGYENIDWIGLRYLHLEIKTEWFFLSSKAEIWIRRFMLSFQNCFSFVHLTLNFRALIMWYKAFTRIPSLLISRRNFVHPLKIRLLTTETGKTEVRQKEFYDTPAVRKYLSEVVMSRRVPKTDLSARLLRNVCTHVWSRHGRVVHWDEFRCSTWPEIWRTRSFSRLSTWLRLTLLNSWSKRHKRRFLTGRSSGPTPPTTFCAGSTSTPKDAFCGPWDREKCCSSPTSCATGSAQNLLHKYRINFLTYVFKCLHWSTRMTLTRMIPFIIIQSIVRYSNFNSIIIK